MLIFIAVMLVLIFFAIIYLIVMVNNGFIVTNTNVDGLEAKCVVLTKKCDEVVTKYSIMTKAIAEDLKGR